MFGLYIYIYKYTYIYLSFKAKNDSVSDCFTKEDNKMTGGGGDIKANVRSSETKLQEVRKILISRKRY
jgi:hypothetical protein